MKAYYYIIDTTDLVRESSPRIRDVSKELYSDWDDFLFAQYLRFIGIKKNYPTAELSVTGTGVCVRVEGVLVYECDIIAVCDDPVEVDA